MTISALSNWIVTGPSANCERRPCEAFPQFAAVGVLAIVGLMFATLPPLAADEPRSLPLPFEPAVVHQTKLEPQPDGSMQLTTLGIDSFLEFALPNIDHPEQIPILAMDYFSTDGIARVELRIAADRGWTPPIDAGGLSIAEGWTSIGLPLVEPGVELWNTGTVRRLRIDFGQQPNRVIRIRNMRFRAPTVDEQRSREEVEQQLLAKRQVATRINEYLSNYPRESSIDVAELNGTFIEFAGICAQPSDNVRLVEIPLHQLPVGPQDYLASQLQAVATLDSMQCDASGAFRVRVPLQEHDDLRQLSRWQIVQVDPQDQSLSALSHARYASQWRPPAEVTTSPHEGLNLKGLNGVSPVFGLDELKELGVGHLALNVVVTDLIDDRQIAGAESFTFAGKEWWVRPGRLNGLDQMTRFADQHKMIVAAIILLPIQSKDIIVHPEANPAGIYAMPNFVDPRGAEKYAAVMHYLAKRYSGMTDVGRIDHWILHNEVDFGWIWTNMGEQPLEVFLETYMRSMRMTAMLAQRWNPRAVAFISLTHHWNVPEDPRMRTYAPRTMLQRFVQFTRAEGDFAWGLAYHPYPENLFDAKVWEDTSVANNIDTERITMKNLEVLKRFLEQPEYLGPAGELRPVILSEQGYHTDGYGEQAQRLQAAALLYTWKKLRETNFVIAFDYHRWVDAADEGGLLLGLRTLPTAVAPAGEKKLGWEVFQAIGTQAEAGWRTKLSGEFPVLSDD